MIMFNLIIRINMRYFFCILMIFMTVQIKSQKKVVGDYIENVPLLHSNGSGWGFYIDERPAQNKKKILFIGDSILMGYKSVIVEKLSDYFLIDCWITPIHEGVDNLPNLLSKIASYRDYDIIHFNIGLHGYQSDRVVESEYIDLMTRYVETLKKTSPNALLFWSSTTPVLIKDRYEIDGDINPIIERRNEKAYQIMIDNNVYVIELYSLMMKHLYYSAKDKFHWNDNGKRIQGITIVDSIVSKVK